MNEFSKFTIDIEDLPEWFKYPDSFLKMVEQNITDLHPWHFLSNELLKSKFKGLNERYPESKLVPFAKRYDNDDVACWEESQPGKVVVIHDFASNGWERKENYDDFWMWFKSAVEEMINFD